MQNCIFCGGKPYIGKLTVGQYNSKNQGYLWFYACTNCGKHTMHAITKEEAKENWEKRKYYPDMIMLGRQLTADTMHDDGVVMLMEAFMTMMHDDLLSAYTKQFRNPDNLKAKESVEILERKLQRSKLMTAAIPDLTAVFRTIKKEALDKINRRGRR